MKFLDICAGIGGFRSGLEKGGHKCIGYIEIDKYARESYQAMYDTENEWTAHDVTKLKPEEIPQAELWCFGFPCQDISVAGKQKGLKGERSGIFYSIINLLKSKSPEDRPEWLLIENVKNLLSLNGGREFTEVLSEISETGYDAEWHLVNSKDYGVPQNRERVFIIGHLRRDGKRQLLPISRTGEQTDREGQAEQQTCEGQSQSVRQKKERYGDRFNHMIGNRKYQSSHVYGIDGVSRACDTSSEIYYAIPKIQTLLQDPHQSESVYGVDGLGRTLTSSQGGGIENGVRTGLYAIPKQIIPGSQGYRVYDSDGVSVTIKAGGGGGGAKTGLYAVPKVDVIVKGSHQKASVQNIDGLSKSLIATDYKSPQKIAVPCLTPDRINKRQNGRRFKENEEPMFTLTAQNRHGVLIYNGKEYHIRRLTPKECFRLQGFTDQQFEKAQAVNSNTQLYKQAGNAVTVNVAYAFGKRLKEIEEASS